MGKYKFFALFKTMSSAEKTDFGQFIQYHWRKDNKAALLYQHLQICDPQILEEYATDARRIPNAVFTDKNGAIKEDAHKDTLNAFEQLFNIMAPKFLVRPGYQKSEWDDQLLWLNELQKRNLDKEFAQQMALSYKEITTKEKQSIQACIAALAIAQKYQQYLFSNLPLFSETEVENCLKTIHHLSAAVQWRMACDLLSTGIYSNQPLPMVMPTVSADQEMIPAFTLLHLYQFIFQALYHHDEACFQKARDLFEQHAQHLDCSEMQLAMRYLQNYLSQKQRNNQDVTPMELHELHKIADQNDIFKQKGILEMGLFGNIADVACNCGAYEWILDFLEKHKSYISLEQRGKMRLLAEAGIAFAQKDFDKVIAIERAHHFKNMTDHLRVKMMALRSAYELDDMVLVLDMVRNLERSSPSKNTSGTTTAVMNFTKIIKLMATGKVTQAELSATVDATNPLYLPQWIKEQLATYKPFGV